MKVSRYIALLFLTISCVKTNKYSENLQDINILNHWHVKDFEKDSIPGISLEKLYNVLLKDRQGKEVIVAVIDTEIDINHEDLKDYIWLNADEIPENGKDEDGNGYVDDIHGWNFIGNTKGENLISAHFSFLRKLNQLAPLYKGKTKEEVGNDTLNFQIYQKALKDHLDMNVRLEEDKDYVTFLNEGFPKSKKRVDSLFHGADYSVTQLDSLYSIYETKDSTLAANIYFMYDFMRYEMDGYADNLTQEIHQMEEYSNNSFYNDREIIGDDINDINDVAYGSSYLTNNLKEFTHGTIVSGVLAANRKNNKGIQGITNAIKLMPLCIQAKLGSETDKDLALAIKYAVDNGAQIINFSANRFYETHNQWVQEALLYAEKHNVLVVKAAGNNQVNLDQRTGYPNQFNNDHTLNNFIVVGASGKTMSKFLKPVWSNYGYESVDLYAPGEEIPTTTPFNTYKSDSGTSMSTAITSGVAALLLSYYPKIKVNDIRQILMESATRYNIPIALEDDSDARISFSKLSKSGGILNAYDAFVLAEKINNKNY